MNKRNYQKRILITGLMALFSLGAFLSTLSLCAEESKIEEKSKELLEADYQLSPYDEIEIRVADEDDLSGTYRINDEGYITFPILGKVKMDGLTMAQVEEKLTKLLEKDYFKTKVTIYAQVKKFHKRKVVISGEVHRPGPYEFGEDKNLSLIELIMLAGGPTEKACLNATTIVRQERKDKTSTFTFKVRAGDILEAKEADMILNSGDRVLIPSASVIVMGEVAKPGKYDFGDANEMTLLGAISIAGGFTRIAAINSVRIIRIDEQGNKKNIIVKVNNIYKGREKDAPLEPNDIIVVPESWF